NAIAIAARRNFNYAHFRLSSNTEVSKGNIKSRNQTALLLHSSDLIIANLTSDIKECYIYNLGVELPDVLFGEGEAASF
ncbi:hypothetical protein, partial [Bacillus spizizenii]|uniref:hypothetical protein n=1 Tax=Bacillus spizizenii TaxID=96241 RepID=UPI001F619983